MSDDEDYNSEEDLDYMPSDGEQVSEEENSGDEEDLSLLQDGESDVKVGSSKRRLADKKKKSIIAARKRKGGIKLEDEKQDEDQKEKKIDEELIRKNELEGQIAQEEEGRKQEKEKKRADDLWASFMSDVGSKAPARSTSNHSSTTQTGLGSLSSLQTKSSTTNNQNKVTITKVFDFAGEEVKVTKQVDADSIEAQMERKKQEMAEEEKSEIQPTALCKTETVESNPLKRPGSGSSGGLNSVLSKIGKKSKIGTLEKSKLDWESFKTKEGIQDDLKIHNKGKQGYTERMAFLNRTDQRQYELERDVRLGSSSKR